MEKGGGTESHWDELSLRVTNSLTLQVILGALMRGFSMARQSSKSVLKVSQGEERSRSKMLQAWLRQGLICACSEVASAWSGRQKVPVPVVGPQLFTEASGGQGDPSSVNVFMRTLGTAPEWSWNSKMQVRGGVAVGWCGRRVKQLLRVARWCSPPCLNVLMSKLINLWAVPLHIILLDCVNTLGQAKSWY